MRLAVWYLVGQILRPLILICIWGICQLVICHRIDDRYRVIFRKSYVMRLHLHNLKVPNSTTNTFDNSLQPNTHAVVLPALHTEDHGIMINHGSWIGWNSSIQKINSTRLTHKKASSKPLNILYCVPIMFTAQVMDRRQYELLDPQNSWTITPNTAHGISIKTTILCLCTCPKHNICF